VHAEIGKLTRTQRMTTVYNRFRPSHPLYNSWQHRRWDDGRARFTTPVVWRQVEHEGVIIFAHILYLKREYLPRGTAGDGWNAATESALPTS